MKPEPGPNDRGEEGKRADIVVCVHNALDDAQRCLESVLDRSSPGTYRLIVVNDGSDDATTQWLRAFADANGALLLESSTAERYTRAANRGLRASTAPFVVLLNSDTIVTTSWLERLLACAESDPAIGIVGPLSNAASYQSVPCVRDEQGDWSVNPLPEGVTPEDMAGLVARLAKPEYPRIPFVNGFCFGIKRAVIDAIGYLDEDAFPNGYGEENDYCLRAAQAGFALAIADDAYVFHAKSKSYSHEIRQTLSIEGAEALARKYGKWHMRGKYRAINKFRGLDSLRASLTAALKDSSRPGC